MSAQRFIICVKLINNSKNLPLQRVLKGCVTRQLWSENITLRPITLQSINHHDSLGLHPKRKRHPLMRFGPFPKPANAHYRTRRFLNSA